MVLLLVAVGLLSIAGLMFFEIGSRSLVGKALGVLSTALGVAFGVTAASVASGLGADERTIASVGLLGCSAVMIVGAAAALRLLRKAENGQRTRRA